MKVLFSFGTRTMQDMPEYTSGRSRNFYFEIETKRNIKTHRGAMWLLRRNKVKFLETLKNGEIACDWQTNDNWSRWIPLCYLKRPEVYITVPFCPLPGKL